MLSSKDRLFEIAGVIKKYDLVKNPTPVNLRLAIEQLGPTFIKLGQIMASRDDVIPKEFCEELSHLRNQVSPMDFDKVLDILNVEYGGKVYEIFKSIDEEPIGSASIAQVHRALLKDGSKVVIKVQREKIDELMTLDVKVLKKLIDLLKIDKIFNSVINFSEAKGEM